MPTPIFPLQPAAAALLAELAATPPETVVVPVHDLTTRYERRFKGEKVRELGRMHAAEAGRLLTEADASRCYDAFDAHCRYDVQTAIRDAIFFARLARPVGIRRAA